jgi:Uma2 family endonuclease
MVAVRKSAPARMTLDEFLSWDPHDRSGRTWQLIDGEPVAMASGNDTHGSLQSEIARLVGNHLLAQAAGHRVLIEPGVVPRVRARDNLCVPDLGVTCAPATFEQLMPEPVPLIDILSDGDEAESWANIWAYATIPSVTEIFAVHSTRTEAELLCRQPDGSWPKEPQIIASDGILALRSIGYSAPLAALYRTTRLATL